MSKSSERRGPWTVLDRRAIYRNDWIELDEHRVINPAGGRGVYGVIHYRSLAIGIIPVDGEGNTWLVGQHRYPLDRFSWEIPAGGGALDVPPIESAQRELIEETGLRAARWDCIQHMELSNSVSDEVGMIWVARDLTLGESEPTAEEQITAARVPLAEAFERVHAGELVDSLTIAGLLKLENLILRGEWDLPTGR